MSRLHRGLIVQLTVLLLVFLPCHNNKLFARQADQREQLVGLFQWAIMDYQNGKYLQVAKNLEPLLSYFGEQTGMADSDQNEKLVLKGKIHLLLGATYERIGNKQKARAHYQLAHEVQEKTDFTIEGIDFSNLEEYQTIIKGVQLPVREESRIIEKPASKSKKKRLTTFLVIAGTAVAAGVTAAVLLKKKKDEGQAFDTDVLGISWIQVNEGIFSMGDNFDEGEPDELPVHNVWLDNYSISRYEVTFEQYDYFCEETQREKPDDNGWGRGNLPVINVSWEDARDFCNWLANKIDKNVHIPTEAQWEKAARGTAGNRYPWGDSPPDCNKANYNCTDRTTAVSSYSQGASVYNVFNMAGNVSEWCRDAYDPGFYTASPTSNPYNVSGEGIQVDFVIRGGSWDVGQNLSVRCADRGYAYYSTKSNTIGFRIVKEMR